MSSPVRLSAIASKLILSTVVCSMALGIVACSGKPENSPVIRKKFAEMDAVQTEVAEATKTLKAIAGDMTVLKDQMSEIRALSPDPSGTIQAVKRLEEIERRLAALDGAAVSAASMAAAPVTPTTTTTATAPAAGTTTTVAATGPIAPAPDAPAALVAKAAETDARPSSQDSLKNFSPAPAAKETAKAEAKPAAAAPAAKPAAVSTSAKKPAETKATKPAAKASTAPRGKYHKVQAGDTLEKIASQHNTSVDSIRSANKLPSGARPLLGQQLFIPQG